MRIGSIIMFHPRKWWKAKFFILCDVIFVVGLWEKFEINIGSGRVKPPSRLIPTGSKTNRLICETFLPRVPSGGCRSVVAGWLVRGASGHKWIPHPRLVNTVVRFPSTPVPPFHLLSVYIGQKYMARFRLLSWSNHSIMPSFAISRSLLW